MIVAKLPWLAVQQYATVALDGKPYTVVDPRLMSTMVLLLDNEARNRPISVDPGALVTVLIPEHDDAIRALKGQFDVSIMED
jgi:hypothetical protein